MLSFIARRLFQSLLVMLTVALIAFAMFRYVGDPVTSMVGQDTTPEQRAELREQLGLNDPFLVQYARFAINAAQGDFGISYRHRRPVGELLKERMPATLELSFVSSLIAYRLSLWRLAFRWASTPLCAATGCCPEPLWPYRLRAFPYPPS